MQFDLCPATQNGPVANFAFILGRTDSSVVLVIDLLCVTSGHVHIYEGFRATSALVQAPIVPQSLPATGNLLWSVCGIEAVIQRVFSNTAHHCCTSSPLLILVADSILD
jgi:hypothetical protein